MQSLFVLLLLSTIIGWKLYVPDAAEYFFEVKSRNYEEDIAA